MAESKSQFIRSMGVKASPKDVVAKAKEVNLEIAVGTVYSVQAEMRKKLREQKAASRKDKSVRTIGVAARTSRLTVPPSSASELVKRSLDEFIEDLEAKLSAARSFRESLP